MTAPAHDAELDVVPDAEVVERSQLTQFSRHCEEVTGLRFPDYTALERFSIERAAEFWRLLLAWSGIRYAGEAEPSVTSADVEHARFFPAVTLSYVENVIGAPEDGPRPALIARTQNGRRSVLTRAQLSSAVHAWSLTLTAVGVGPGDHVVAVVRNTPEAVVAALATAACGASFSSAAPDMGSASIVSRFGQLSPTVLLAELDDGADRAVTRAIEVSRGLPSLRAVVALGDRDFPPGGTATRYRMSLDTTDAVGVAGSEPVRWARYPFNHPLFTLFSSGTTGPPKCIVHGAGGTLLEHVKEHRLHGDLKRDDVLFFHTSTAWMMWNWQLSALATGAAIVLYDGPVTDPSTLWRIVAEEGVTVFGTSPPYLRLCEAAGYRPRADGDLRRLRAVMSTGSVLHDTQYDWVWDNVGRLPLWSVSGGTDIIGCFLLGNPNRPVRRGELQSRSLGMDVKAHPVPGTSRPGMGELICTSPFPSRPLCFAGDPDGSRFHAAYFAENPGAWTHGDFIEFTPRGGARIMGRSDGVLNVGGVRIGPAEIYRILAELPEIRETLAVEQAVDDPDDPTRIVLAVVAARSGGLDDLLRRRIRRLLAEQGSAAHVPAIIVEVPELPTTHSGKVSERAAHDVLAGLPATNLAAIRNPSSLDVLRWQVTIENARLTAATDRVNAPDRIESDLCDIWQRVLHLPVALADDNFFALGGTSVQALRVFDEVDRRLGVRLPLSSLFENPTPSSLAGLLRGDPRERMTPVVELRPGTGRPIYVLHDLTGDVLYQRTFVEALRTDRPVVGLRAVETYDRARGQTTVEEMAAFYVDHLRLAQPNGPYSLVGYSFGGLVAFEMARLLDDSGDGVDLLAVLDSYLAPASLGRRVTIAIRRTLELVGAVLASPGRRIPRLIRRVAAERLPRLGITQQDADITEPPGIPGCVAANRAYRATPYPGSVVFLRADERRPGYLDPTADWRPQVSGGLEIVSVPGDHFTVMLSPNAEVVAEQVAARLTGTPACVSAPDRTTAPASADAAIAARDGAPIAGTGTPP